MQGAALPSASEWGVQLGVDLCLTVKRKIGKCFGFWIINGAPKRTAAVARQHRLTAPTVFTASDVKKSAGERIDIDDLAVAYNNANILSVIVAYVLYARSLVATQR